MLPIIFKNALFLIAGLAIIGCVLHFFYICLSKPADFVELEWRANLSLELARRYENQKTTWPAIWFRVCALTYILLVFLGIGFCIYGGVSRLFSWVPHSWGDKQALAAVSAFLGAMGLIGITIKTAHKLNDLEASIRELTIRSGDSEYFRRLLSAAKFPDTKYPPNRWTLLHQLAALGNETRPVHVGMAKQLLKSGANVNCRTELGWTPLHLIAMQGQAQAVEFTQVLIAHGLDLTAVDNVGRDWKSHWQQGNEIYDLLKKASTQ